MSDAASTESVDLSPALEPVEPVRRGDGGPGAHKAGLIAASPLAGWGVGNAGASIRVTRNFDLYARVLNVTDRYYEEALGFPALRRNAIVGVRVAAGR